MVFVSILGTSSKQGKRVCITSKKLGTFYLDVTTNEQHTAKLRVTDNPIESGSRVSDHAVIDPKEITLTGIVVGYSPPIKLMSAIGKGNLNFEDYPLPVEGLQAHSKRLIRWYQSIRMSTVKQKVD